MITVLPSLASFKIFHIKLIMFSVCVMKLPTFQYVTQYHHYTNTSQNLNSKQKQGDLLAFRCVTQTICPFPDGTKNYVANKIKAFSNNVSEITSDRYRQMPVPKSP